MGDTLSPLRANGEGDPHQASLVVEALRWSLAHTSFDFVLLTNGTSLIHIGRLWLWFSSLSVAQNCSATVDPSAIAVQTRTALSTGGRDADTNRRPSHWGHGVDAVLGRAAAARACCGKIRCTRQAQR